MVIKRYFILFSILSLLANLANAQEEIVISGTNNQDTEQNNVTDTIPVVDIEDSDLDNIISLRAQFEKQNQLYSTPATPNENLLRFLKKDEVELSDEAMYWAHLVRDASTIFDSSVTFQDTIIVNPLFLPIIFKGKLLPDDLSYYDKDAWKTRVEIPLPFTPDSLFKEERLRREIQNKAYKYVETNFPSYFRYSMRDLPQDKVIAEVIAKPTYQPDMIKVESEADFSDVDAPVKFIPERRYWTSNFESSIQFAQAYFSPNWHDGNQHTNINLNTRNYFKYDYNKDKIRLTNELELKISANNAPKDTVRSVSITDNDIRIHSNFGYQAYRKWYYSFDLSANSKIFDSYNANDTITRLSGFLAPLSVTIGIGMKYDLDKQLSGNKYRKIHFDINIAPLSMTYRYSRYKERFDFGRHGFDGSKVDDEGRIRNHQTYFGSNVKANLKWQFNRNTIWTSRFEYDTSYQRIFWIFENRLEMAISRFFSTQITINMRYDDAGNKNIDLKDTYLQLNEALTFGFSYRW